MKMKAHGTCSLPGGMRISWLAAVGGTSNCRSAPTHNHQRLGHVDPSPPSCHSAYWAAHTVSRTVPTVRRGWRHGPDAGRAHRQGTVPGGGSEPTWPKSGVVMIGLVAALSLFARRRGDRSVVGQVVMIVSLAGGALLAFDVVMEALAGR
jgi:hypothetical protein